MRFRVRSPANSISARVGLGAGGKIGAAGRLSGTAEFVVRFLAGHQARTGLELRIPRLYADEEEPRLAL